MTAERIRTTISVDPEVLQVFRTMADAAGLSLSRCMGDWLGDTVDGAQFVAQKMQEARRAPVTVMREMQAFAHGLQSEMETTLDVVRAKAKAGGGGMPQAPTAARSPKAPSSNTGLNSRRTGRARP
jgi:hypothetical protein